MAQENGDGRPLELTADQVREVFERRTQQALSMSGDEFIRRLDEGSLPEKPAVDEIAVIVGGDDE